MGSVPQNRSATNGFHRKSAHQSGGGERGSSRKRSPPETRAPSQPESTPRQRFAGNPHAKAAAEGVLLRRIAGERPSEQRIQRFEAGQARLVQRNGSAGKERRASRSSSRGSVSPGKHASGAGKFRAAGVDNSTFRRIVGGTSERRIQRFEVGQARFVQRKSFAGEERAEPAGAHPAVAFRREAARWALGRPALRGWTILRSVESSGVRPSSGFSASKPGRRGSSSGRVLPGRSAPSQPELVLRQRFAGKPRAGRWGDPRRGGGQFYAP